MFIKKAVYRQQLIVVLGAISESSVNIQSGCSDERFQVRQACIQDDVTFHIVHNKFFSMDSPQIHATWNFLHFILISWKLGKMFASSIVHVALYFNKV